MNNDKYFVSDENTLCYHIPNHPWGWFGVLGSSVLRGGLNSDDGSYPPSMAKNVRPATLADFEFFRVSPVGHILPPSISWRFKS